MITAITNTASKTINGTSYYSDGCLYTTSYSTDTTVTVPYVSTYVNESGTYYTSSANTVTTNTYLGGYLEQWNWTGASISKPLTRATNKKYIWSYGGSYKSYSLLNMVGSNTATVIFTETHTIYRYTASTVDNVSDITDAKTLNWSLFGVTETFDVDGDQYGSWCADLTSEEYSLYFDRTFYNKEVSSRSLISAYISFENGDTVTFGANMEGWSDYTSGYGEYGQHTGAVISNSTTFNYINKFATVEETTTEKSVYTVEGAITEQYQLTTSEKSVYSTDTYTVSSFFDGYNVSTSEKMVVDQYTQTLYSHGTAPSAMSAFMMTDFVLGEISWEMNGKDEEAKDRKYIITNYFSVNNQREKSYLVSRALRNGYAHGTDDQFLMEDVTAYVIPPYYRDYVRDRVAYTTSIVNSEQKNVFTASGIWGHDGLPHDFGAAPIYADDPHYCLSVYEITSWNPLWWGPVFQKTVVSTDTISILGKIFIAATYGYNDTIYGVGLGDIVYSTEQSILHWGNYKVSGGWGFSKANDSWYNQHALFTNTTAVTSIATTTSEVQFNGIGKMTYNLSYTMTTTYNCDRTYFVTGENNG